VSPEPYAYSDHSRTTVQEVGTCRQNKFGIDINYLKEAGWSAATCMIGMLRRESALGSFIASLEGMNMARDRCQRPTT
jgi:hypothetical protein